MYNAKFVEDAEFYTFVFDNGFTYDIVKSVCATREQLAGWIEHLQEKTWFDYVLETDFTKAFMKNHELSKRT